MVDVPLWWEVSLQGCLAEGRENQGLPRATWEAPVWVFYLGKRHMPGGEVWDHVSWGWQVQTIPSASWGVSDCGFSANEARFAPPIAQSLVSLRCREGQRVSPFARCRPQLAPDKRDGCVSLTPKECPLRSVGGRCAQGQWVSRESNFLLGARNADLQETQRKKWGWRPHFLLDFVLLGPQKFLNINHEQGWNPSSINWLSVATSTVWARCKLNIHTDTPLMEMIKRLEIFK